MHKLLEVTDLYKSFGGVTAVDGVSFELKEGQLLAMIGPNGAGKSTCFNLINGQLRPDKGRIKVLGRDTTGLKPRHVWRLGVGRTFQVTSTFASMTVLENVQMVLLSASGHLNSVIRRTSRLYVDEAMELLKLVGVEEQWDRPCGILAYGDLKRVELAIALANKPKLLLMDEPTAGMGIRERLKLMELIAQIVKAQNIGVLFTEHDMDVVFAHADWIIVLNYGKLIAEGTPAQVRDNEEVKRIYLGSCKPENP
ncbi:MAG: ABC transporter ATP-binding protein [Deltaproteobacteria bacterium]|nr:ABC transporter ATP-binding protein [Deltaproteobacteria bacterium]MBW1929402.1 ABC transporter ATP-binding protein [Deltaproteobacteria bacterium]MBW2025554.1 ABC transporter ATP-binding protein [Deltaproteobacteria bacterium]MBW2126717.1 ABC transporter ATP-binding protein [Deltaproteobacteria bacterium]RLB21761.1 MAG: ABC transporter ATP-binding protein [Deltaproteobacteria bacterium]